MSRRSASLACGKHAGHAQHHVVERAEPGHQAGRLEHQAAVGAGIGHFAAIEHDHAFGDVGQPGHHRQHGGLAAARVADDRNELALADLQVKAIDHGLRAFGRGVDLDDLREVDEAVVGAGGGQRGVDA